MLSEDARARFDALVEEVIDGLPRHVAALLDEVPVVVLDRPTPAMLKDLGLGIEDALDLCGLHTGVALTERSVEAPATLPTDIHLFREGHLALVHPDSDEGDAWDFDWDEEGLLDEIEVTLLHEIGHHFGLDEGDLADLGYD